MHKLKVVVPDELASWKTFFQSENIMDKMFPAAGASITFLVKIDLTLVDPKKLSRFRDNCNTEHKHYARLGERDAEIDGKPFKFFAMQATGAGCFPSKYANSEVGINVMTANINQMLNLGENGIEYDILSVRSCIRGTTYSNSVQFAAPATNMAMVYGLGGLGITSMVSNGLLMNAIIGLREELGKGEITEEEFFDRLRSSNFNSIPHYDYPNPFKRNYAPFIDKQVRVVAKRFGFERAAQRGTSYFKVSRKFLQLLKKIAT